MHDLSIRNFEKTFRQRGRTTTVACPNLRIESGTPAWLQGANGTGKTTLLRCVAGWIVAFAGTINYDDVEIARLWAPTRTVSLFPAFDFLPHDRSFDEIVATTARYVGVDHRVLGARVAAEQERFGATGFARARRGEWSTGEGKRLALALFFSLDAPIALLDGIAAAVTLDNGHLRLEVLVDRTSIETFANGGRVSMSSTFLPSSGGAPLALYASGGVAKIVSMQVFALDSAWTPIINGRAVK